MIKLENKDQCCGCTACSSICPKGAISMAEDNEGFKYPIIDKSKCINCHLCEKVCPFIKNNIKHSKKINEVIACNAIDEDILMQSSSGGIFYRLAEKVIQNNGVVFGVSMINNVATHTSITDINDICKLQGSKYVQSNINNSFLEVKKFLNDSKMVLFVGTPCQINGLKLFLRKDYDNLFTCDFICHGVPSPKVFKDYVSTLGNIEKINFREKSNGWKNYKFSFLKSKKRVSEFFYDNSYISGFLKNYYLRMSCYNCNSKGSNRLSDITLGDNWGIDKDNKNYNYLGNSLIIINTEKGKRMFDKIKLDLLYTNNSNYNFKNNPAYLESVKLPKERSEFFSYYESNNIQDTFKKFKLYPSNKRKVIIFLSKVKKLIWRW